MIELIKFELYKIIKRKSTIISVLAIFVLSAMVLVGTVSNEHYKKSGTEGYKKGISAISQKREEASKLEGEVNKKSVVDIVKRNSELSNDPNAKDIPLYGLPYNMYLENPKSSKTIYSDRIKVMENVLDKQTYPKYLKQEKEKVIKNIKDMKIPIHYKYSAGWENILTVEADSIAIYLLVVICICIAPIFASEYQNGTDNIILSTKKGKDKLILSKFIAGFVFTTVLYIAFCGFIILSRLLVYGFSGWDIEIQNIYTYWFSMYNITMLKAVGLFVLVGYLASIATMVITMLISSKMKTTFASITIALILTIGPRLVEVGSSRFMIYLRGLLPVNMANVIAVLGDFKFYNVFGKLIWTPAMMVFTVVVLMIVALPLAYKFFKNHEVA